MFGHGQFDIREGNPTRSRYRSLATAWALIVAGASVVGAGSLSAALPPPMPVAVQNQNAPFNGTYSSLGTPVLSGTGQVAFATDALGGATRRVIVSSATPTSPGTAQNVAVSGGATGVGGTFTLFSTPTQSRNGILAFAASQTGGTSLGGVYTGNAVGISVVALGQTTAPTGNLFGTPGNPAVNNAGQVAFTALTGYGSGTTADGLFVGAPGSLQTVALQGTAPPVDSSFGNYQSFEFPRINGSGLTVFQARIGLGYTGIFARPAGGPVQVVAFETQPAPGGGFYSTIGQRPTVNDAGQIAFSTHLQVGAATSGIFLGTVGAIQPVALRGGGTPAGGNFGLLETNVALNGAGKVAFKADVNGGPTSQGVFLGNASSLVAVAAQGGSAPGGGNFASFNDPTLNDIGQVAFTATVVTGGNNSFALFGGDVGNLTRVVSTGDLVDVIAGGGVEMRTVNGITFFPGSGGQDGLGVSLASNGTVAYKLTFTDGTNGIFVSAVPEPSAATLLLAAAAARASLRRRRR